MTLRDLVGAMLVAALLICGCSSKQRGAPRLKTTPVKGAVHVDGQPAAGLTVECHPQPGADTIKHPVIAVTDAEGRFSLGMYEAGDGLPEGTYNLVFLWELGMDQRDKLKRAYADPQKSKHQVTVVKGQPNDLGVIELFTKEPT